MTKHVGIVACSAEGAALCYRTFCNEAQALMGEHWHPEVSLHTHSLGEYMVHIRRGDWQGVAELMLSSCRKLAACGAELAISPDNTIHEAFDLVAERSPIPWLHIARAVADEAQDAGFKTLGVTGTKSLSANRTWSRRRLTGMHGAKASEGRCGTHRMSELTKPGARPAPSLRARAAGLA